MDEHFNGFASYLADILPSLTVRLEIPKSSFCRGISASLCGIDSVVAAYAWKSEWSDQNGVKYVSHDWITTKASIHKLRAKLSAALNDSGNTMVMY